MVSRWVVNPPPLTPVPEESSIDEVTPALLKIAVRADDPGLTAWDLLLLLKEVGSGSN